MTFEQFKRALQLKDVRNSIVFVLAMLVIVRILTHIPVPGIEAGKLKAFLGSNQIFGLLNIFTGGGLENLSVVMLGVGPYITASIIFQLLGVIVPKIEEIQKEGEWGQKKINQWTRMLTVPLALLQSYGTIIFLQRAGGGQFGQLIGDLSIGQLLTTMIVVTAGTVFMMWIGELISERKVGNGISLLIFAGIIVRIPKAVQQALLTYDSSQLISWILFIGIIIVTIIGVVYITEAQRNIPVHYARQIRGFKSSGGGVTHLPLKVNMAGVIPIIFAISVILFPPLIAQFFLKSSQWFLSHAAEFTITLFQNQIFYALFYFSLVVIFTYFYTAIIFNPTKIAENLQKQGGFIPGIRPGVHTADYLGAVINRLLLAGSVFLGIIAVLPTILRDVSGGANFVIGGTSLLIVVGVVIEIMNQIESQITMRDYETL